MTDLKKASFLLERSGEPGTRGVWFYPHEDDGFPQLWAGREVWEDMGKPDEITVTVEPGDTLNEYDPGTDEHRAGRPSPP